MMSTPFDKQPFNPFNTVTGSNRSFATRPGRIPLSQDRLRRMHPEIYQVKPWMSGREERFQRDEEFKIHVAEHLRYGLAEAAIVMLTDPLLIACYTEEIDAMAVLFFVDGTEPHPIYGKYYPDGLATELIQRHGLQKGSHLLSVNTFASLQENGGYEPDLRPGPKARGVWGNFAPYIADFLTSDLRTVEERKGEVEAWEWSRCQELAQEYWSHVVGEQIRPRDGRLMTCLIGDKQQWLPGHEPIQ
jgi:hypothetical protein